MGYMEGDDLRGKLRLRADGGLWLGLPRWAFLPVSHENSLKSALELNRRAALFPLWPLPYRQHSKEGYPAQVNTEGPAPLQLIRGPKQRNRAKMKEECKTLERELSKEDKANLSDGEFIALVIKNAHRTD